MRHRIANFYNGFGNSEPVRLDNNITLEKNEFWNKFLDDAMENFKTIKEYAGFDFHLDQDGFTFGIEPSYQGDDLQIIRFDFKDKTNSFIEQGRSFGVYGSKCLTRVKKYSEYKKLSKFIRFIDKWWDLLKSEINKVMELLEK